MTELRGPYVSYPMDTGHSYGGSQSWSARRDVRAYGCGLVACCDVLHYLARRRPDCSMNVWSSDYDEVLALLERCGRACVDEDGADAVILGCLGFAAMGRELTARLGVPVIDPAAVIIPTAESLVAQGLCHSRRSWPAPPAAERFWGAGRIPPLQ